MLVVHRMQGGSLVEHRMQGAITEFLSKFPEILISWNEVQQQISNQQQA